VANETLSDVGEFGLIARIAGTVTPGSEIIGIGDDAAVFEGPRDTYLLATVDMHLQDVHFRLADMPARDIGATALAVNISDIAAMGGAPHHALISLALPPRLPVAVIDELYLGMLGMADRFGVSIVGGNITSTPGPLAIDITLLGDVPRDQLLLRRGARPGDLLAVTGALGGRAAIRLARDAGIPDAPAIPVPLPQVEIARIIAESHLATAMMDISGGLASDVHHVARASRAGIVIRESELPIAPEATQFAQALGTTATKLALTGGEEYELLLTLPPENVERANHLLSPRALWVIGVVVDQSEGMTLIQRDGTRSPLEAAGWRHF
jgi:thiamine-monophosphate kinase